jgi:hypothetical protein
MKASIILQKGRSKKKPHPLLVFLFIFIGLWDGITLLRMFWLKEHALEGMCVGVVIPVIILTGGVRLICGGKKVMYGKSCCRAKLGSGAQAQSKLKSTLPLHIDCILTDYHQSSKPTACRAGSVVKSGLGQVIQSSFSRTEYRRHGWHLQCRCFLKY